jgi:hypothetical protein
MKEAHGHNWSSHLSVGEVLMIILEHSALNSCTDKYFKGIGQVHTDG